MSQSTGQRIGRKEKQQSIGSREIERFRSDEDKAWNFRSNKQKAGSSRGVARIFSPSPIKTVATQGHSQTDFLDR